MKGAPKSDIFDDVYFSAEDGLAETHHVFLHGNDLPRAWQEIDHGKKEDAPTFVIGETGFGTGLNFLATWKLFEETANRKTRLHYISIEKHPLDSQEIGLYLQPWADEFRGYLQRLQEHYPLLVPGFHTVNLTERVMLTLIFDDVKTALPQLEAEVDAWFLDGFKPSTNPDMWSDDVFTQMARLSVPGATLSTFTAAAAVRLSLDAAGFKVIKTKGFGRKRDMIMGYKR